MCTWNKIDSFTQIFSKSNKTWFLKILDTEEKMLPDLIKKFSIGELYRVK